MLLYFLTLSLSFAGPEVSADRPSMLNPDAEPSDVALVDLGQLVIETLVPAEVLVDGRKVVQLFTSGRLTINVLPGKRNIRVYTNGNPQDVVIEILPTGETLLIIGRTGITTGQPRQKTKVDPNAVAQVSFRATRNTAAQIRIGTERYYLEPETVHPLEIPTGRHDMSVRSHDGTAIWASGVLTLDGGAVVVQISEGRMPEVTGDGRFTARGH
jgi:hypothetical protein